MVSQQRERRYLKRKMPSGAMGKLGVFQAVQPFKPLEMHLVWKWVGSASTKLQAWAAEGHRKPSSKRNVHSGSAHLALSPEVGRLRGTPRGREEHGMSVEDSPRHPHTQLCLPNDCLQNMGTLTTLLTHKSLSNFGEVFGQYFTRCGRSSSWRHLYLTQWLWLLTKCLFCHPILYWASSALFFGGFFFQFYSFTLDLIFC